MLRNKRLRDMLRPVAPNQLQNLVRGHCAPNPGVIRANNHGHAVERLLRAGNDICLAMSFAQWQTCPPMYEQAACFIVSSVEHGTRKRYALVENRSRSGTWFVFSSFCHSSLTHCRQWLLPYSFHQGEHERNNSWTLPTMRQWRL